MSKAEQAESGFAGFKGMRRKPIKLTQEGLVSRGQLEGCGPLPLLLETNGSDVSLPGWAETNLGMIQEKLSKHGAILFRGFGREARTVHQDGLGRAALVQRALFAAQSGEQQRLHLDRLSARQEYLSAQRTVL